VRPIESLIIDSPTSLLGGVEPHFREQFNRTDFALTHRLSEHPLLQLPRLLELARSMDKEDLYYDAGPFQIGQRWNTRQPCDLSVEQLIERIENAGAWIILRNIHLYEPFAELVERCLDECLAFVGDPWRRQIEKRVGIIFVTSPDRIATYHIDRECSLLFQIRGEKEISIFDKNDREVLPEEEIERFWTVDNNAAVYKPQYQARARVYRLRPGAAVHIPVNAPHWVKNDDNVSISLNVNFQFRDGALANVYRANHYLRSLGLEPTPPGRSGFRDAIKASAISGAQGIVRGIRRIRSGLSGSTRRS
jgi:hypothetical protein